MIAKDPHISRNEPETQEEGEGRIEEERETVTDMNEEIIQILKRLTLQQHVQAINMLKKYRDIFTTKDEDLKTPLKVPPVKIKLKDDYPSYQAHPYRLGEKQQRILDDKLENLIEANILE